MGKNRIRKYYSDPICGPTEQVRWDIEEAVCAVEEQPYAIPQGVSVKDAVARLRLDKLEKQIARLARRLDDGPCIVPILSFAPKDGRVPGKARQ